MVLGQKSRPTPQAGVRSHIPARHFGRSRKAQVRTSPSSNIPIMWGARPHPFRTGGPAVNSGPLLRLPWISTCVRELARPCRWMFAACRPCSRPDEFDCSVPLPAKKKSRVPAIWGGTGTRVGRAGGARGWSALRAAVSIGTMIEMIPLSCRKSNERRSFPSTVGAIARARGRSGLGCHWGQE